MVSLSFGTKAQPRQAICLAIFMYRGFGVHWASKCDLDAPDCGVSFARSQTGPFAEAT